MKTLISAILDDDLSRVRALLAAEPGLATARAAEPRLYRTGILHWLYRGDTALHLAACGHRDTLVRALLKAGADANAAANHRRGRPLHYAADGSPGTPGWDPARQVRTIRVLLEAGAELDARDKNGATALHRAVRTRAADAVRCLLDAGADPAMRNQSGSTPFHLAVQGTGRGGAGTPAALAAQRTILAEFLARGVSPELRDGRGRTVLDWAVSPGVRALLTGSRSE